MCFFCKKVLHFVTDVTSILPAQFIKSISREFYMNKKIIAVAIAAAVAAPSAFAANNTTMYGKIHMSVNNSTGATDAWQTSSHATRWGIKGAEDLGNGLKAVFQYEVSYDPDEGGAFGGARNSFLGLAGDFGTFLVGRHDTPAKVAFYAAGNERLGDSILDLHGSFGFAELRTDDAIAYVSPSMSGFKAAVAVVPGETAAADGIVEGMSFGVMYGANGIKAGFGYTDLEDITGGDSTLMNAGVSGTFGDFSVGAQYQAVEHAGNERDVFAVTGTAKFGNNKVIAMYGNADDDAAGDRDTWGLALQHIMSKRTSVYVAYRNDDGSAGLSNPWVGNGGTTRTDDAISLGMIHSF